MPSLTDYGKWLSIVDYQKQKNDAIKQNYTFKGDHSE